MTKVPLKDLKWAVAYHEAGHALAALSVGLPVKECIIRANGRSGEQTNDEPTIRIISLSTLAARHAEQDRIFVLMAGKAAESVYWASTDAGEPVANDTSREDFAMAFEIARELVSEGAESKMVGYHMARARDFFAQERNQSLLHLFAKRLFVKCRLTRSDMDAIIVKFEGSREASSEAGSITVTVEHPQLDVESHHSTTSAPSAKHARKRASGRKA